MTDIFGDEGAEFEAEVVRDEPQAEHAPVVESIPEPVAEIANDAKVPLAALNESRAQLRQTQAELSQMRQQMADFGKLKQEIEDFRSTQRQKQMEQEFNSDPLGVIQKQLRELDSKVAGRDQGAQQVQQETQVFQSIASQVQEFKKGVPDYDDALAHVLESRKQELMAMGALEHEAAQRVGMEAQELATNALRAGQNPGQIVYNLAKLRGYAAKQAAAKLETVARGQAASTSLSQASGGTDRGELSLTQIEAMDDGEFDKFWKKFEKEQRGSRASH